MEIDTAALPLALDDEVAASEQRAETLDALGSTLDRLASAVGASDDPDARLRRGALARTMLEEHAGAGSIDADEAGTLAGGYDARLAEADADRLIRSDPVLARRLIADPAVFAGLTPERRAIFARAAEARIAALPMDRQAGVERAGFAHTGTVLTEAARNRAGLGRRMAAGEAGFADIAAAEAAGEIEARAAGALRVRLTARREKPMRDAEGISRVEAALAEGRRLDPASSDDRAAVDAHYLGSRRGWEEAGLTLEEVRGELVDYLSLAAIVPENVSRRIGRIFRVGTPGERWEAADLIIRLGDARPELLGQINTGDVRTGLGIAALEKAGWPVEQAADRYAALQVPDFEDQVAGRDRVAIGRVQDRVMEAAMLPNGPPAPLRKPRYRPRIAPPLPANREWFLEKQGEVWDDFYSATARLPGITPTERHALQMVFGQEGGRSTNAVTKAASGILPRTLQGLITTGKVSGIEAGTAPEALSIEQRAVVYRAYFDDVLATVGGGTALGRIPDADAAAVFADVLFREGRKGGSRLIQQAVNAVQPGRLEGDGEMGQKVFDAFTEMVRDPKRRDRLLNHLADQRLQATGGKEQSRFDFYRPQKGAGSPVP